MANENNQTLIFVHDYDAFIAKHGIAKLDKHIAEEFYATLGKSDRKQIVSSIKKGYIFAWESPFPTDVMKDLRFALNINYAGIVKTIEGQNDNNTKADSHVLNIA